MAKSSPPRSHGNIIVVTNKTTFDAAISAAVSGTTIILEDGNYGSCSINYYDFSPAGITIRARNRRAAVFDYLSIGGTTGSHYIKFIGIKFVRDVGYSISLAACSASNSTNLHWFDCEFSTSEDGDPDNNAIGLSVYGAGHLIQSCDFHDVNLAINIGSGPMRVVGNHSYDNSRDAINLVTGSNVIIERNIFERFIAEYAHLDGIQTWTTGTAIGCEDVIVRDNIIFDETYGGVHGLFLQMNSGYPWPIKRWTIENNLIVTSGLHGISFETDAEDCIVRNNTVITYLNATVPVIWFRADGGWVHTNIDVTDNVSALSLNGDPAWYNETGTITPQWTDKTADTYYEKLFINMQAPRTVQDCLPVPGSLVDFSEGVGAYALLDPIEKPPVWIETTTSATDQLQRTFIVHEYPGGDLPGSGVTYTWDFGDGSATEAGTSVGHIFDDVIGWMRATCTVGATGYSKVVPKGIKVETPMLIDISCDSTFYNAGEVTSATSGNQAGDLSWGGGYADGGLNLTGSAAATVTNCGIGLSGMAELTISVDVKYISGGSNAYCLHLYDSYWLNLRNTGSLNVTIQAATTSKNIIVSSGNSAPLYDGNWHNIHVTYNSATGTAKIWIDGSLVATDATLSGPIKLQASNRFLALSGDNSSASHLTGGVKNVMVLKKVIDYGEFSSEITVLRGLRSFPRLSAATAVKTGSTTATCTITTDQAVGTIGVVCTTSATKPNGRWILMSLDGAGIPTPGKKATVSSVGVKTFDITGLAANTLYHTFFTHYNDHELYSDIYVGPTFTTDP